MTAARIPDVYDSDIRAMVLSNHRPEETWTVGGELLAVHCEMCGSAWPCESIRAARRVKSQVRDQ